MSTVELVWLLTSSPVCLLLGYRLGRAYGAHRRAA